MYLSGARRTWLAGAVVAGLALLTARLSEAWGGFVPCALCLLERWPYRVAIILLALALLWRQPARWLVGLAAAVMLAGAGLGAVHVGVEQGYWPSPLPECQAPRLGGGTVAERLARMPARPAKPCDDPSYLVPGFPVSMAAMNTGLSFLIGAGLAASVLSRRTTDERPA